MDRIKLFNFLIDCGCCERCGLRFLENVNVNFDDPEHEVARLVKNENEDDGHVAKKVKCNPCVICLDLLQDATLESMVSSLDLKGALEYDCSTFVNFISFPISTLIREHSMTIYIREKFPDFQGLHIVPINKAWSLAVQNRIAKIIHKSFDRNSLLHVQFSAVYQHDHEETSVLSAVCKVPDKRLKHGINTLSRGVVGEFLKTIEVSVFRKYVTVPPSAPSESVILQNVLSSHEAIYIAGRYCKFSRAIGQTPWVIDDVKIVENSVQEIIFSALDNTFNCKSLVFSSSGREDFDVRTLGRGRPFFIKICDPKITNIMSEKFRSIEKTIRATKLISVRDLQFIDRKDLNMIKEGEQFKQKTYRALCITQQPDKLENCIDKINSINALILQQKTPIRVYHRRSSDIRRKEIHRIEARAINGRPNLFEVDMVTQAGTYIKEFIHGDLGRTKPSLGDLIGDKVDIITLDVMDIHLDFPPSLNP